MLVGGVAMNEKISRAAAIEKEMLALEAKLKAKVKELRAFYAEYQQKWDRLDTELHRYISEMDDETVAYYFNLVTEIDREIGGCHE